MLPVWENGVYQGVCVGGAGKGSLSFSLLDLLGLGPVKILLTSTVWSGLVVSALVCWGKGEWEEVQE